MNSSIETEFICLEMRAISFVKYVQTSMDWKE